jgi:hypothetical protein
LDICGTSKTALRRARREDPETSAVRVGEKLGGALDLLAKALNTFCPT